MENNEKLEVIRKDLISDFNDGYLMLRDTVELIEVKDERGIEKAGDLNKQIKNAIKKIDERRADEKKPFLQMGKDIDAEFKIYLDKFKPMVKILDDKIRPVLLDIQKKKQAHAEKMRLAEVEQMKRRADELATMAADNDDDEMLEMAAAVETETAKVADKDISIKGRARGAVAVTSLKTTWKVKIINDNDVDRLYCSADSKKINELLRAKKADFDASGKDEISDYAGLCFYKSHDISSR